MSDTNIVDLLFDIRERIAAIANKLGAFEHRILVLETINKYNFRFPNNIWNQPETCDKCGCVPAVIYRLPTGKFCEKCAFPQQTNIQISWGQNV